MEKRQEWIDTAGVEVATRSEAGGKTNLVGGDCCAQTSLFPEYAAWFPPDEVVNIQFAADAARANRLPVEKTARKALPVCSGVLDYFPDAIIDVAKASMAGNAQHIAGQPLRWDRSKSTDDADALVRHLLERGMTDVDGVRHSAKVAWRALALLQKEIEEGK